MERRRKSIPTGVRVQSQGLHGLGEENEFGTCVRQLG